MNDENASTGWDGPRGKIEPHAGLLQQPALDQPLFKVLTVENLIRSIRERYLHFTRVDAYRDFDAADGADGEQLPLDREGNAKSLFQGGQGFSAANYYDQFRSRAYASCFSLENTSHIWNNYGSGGTMGKVCLVTTFGALKSSVNATLRADTSALLVGSALCRQIFDVNYGLVEYVDRDRAQLNEKFLPNPISYIYTKAREYSHERELRVSLSTIGFGKFTVKGIEMQFPSNVKFTFDLKNAMRDQVFGPLLASPDCDMNFLKGELDDLGIDLEIAPSNPSLQLS